MRDVDLFYRKGTATLVLPEGLQTVTIPERVRSEFERVLASSDKRRASPMACAVLGSQRLLTRMSYNLSGLFDYKYEKINSTVGELLESSGVTALDTPKIYELAEELQLTLHASYSSRSKERRRRLAETIFESPVALEVELLGWEGLVQSQDAHLLHRRDNAIEGTIELLFEFKQAKFLVATCRTGKVVILPVGVSVTSCEQAQAWLAGDTVSGFELPRFFSRGRS